VISSPLFLVQEWEFVYGAHDAGIRSASFVLASLGVDIDTEEAILDCEDFWGWYNPEDDDGRRRLTNPRKLQPKRWWAS
jgi:hypothetical protein